MNTALLIIDAQFDFCDPKGALYVPGAEKDMERLASFIENNMAAIGHIVLTLDTHPVYDIAHPGFWQDSHGIAPEPFTQITSEQVRAGQWIPRFHADKALNYLINLERDGKFPHLIWPEHCLAGSVGNSLHPIIFEAVMKWATITKKDYQTVIKGTYPLTEHFGIFAAQIPDPAYPETQINTALINALNAYEQVLVAGEAKTHCVATSLQQAMDFAPELAKKMIILEDCMSDVTGLGHLGAPTYEQAKQLGLSFIDSLQRLG